MIKEIKNEKLTVQILTEGAQLWSVKDQKGREYLWQGSPDTWKDRAPVLFPYIGRMTDKTYRYEGKPYQMKIHGIAMYSEFQVCEEEEDRITFVLKDNQETKKQYPFSFAFEVTYELVDARLEITYHVRNQGKNTMYFAVGGHPGFQVPFHGQGVFEDYEIAFEEGKKPERIRITDDGYVNAQKGLPAIYEENPLKLSHGMFDHDAIILKDMGAAAVLRSKQAGQTITVKFPQMNYLGIWHYPKVETPYVCLEPWSSLPSRKGVVEDLEKQEDLIKLDAGKDYSNIWSIEIQGTQE